MKYIWLYFFISALIILPGLISLVLFGLRPSIDFTGGTELQLHIIAKENSSIAMDSLKSVMNSKIEVHEVRILQNGDYLFKTKPIDVAMKNEIVSMLQPQYALVREVRFETIGPTLGKELIMKTLIAILLSSAGILFYIAYRFRELRYGVCAVLAILHDSFVVLGIFSLLGHFLHVEVDVLFVTALLTMLSFSVHDTVVVYDRIRELRQKNRVLTYEEIINKAVTETLSRSLNNSLTIIFMLSALWLLGGETIRWFVFALLIGTITGTYSSTFTAAPLLVIWEKIKRRRL